MSDVVLFQIPIYRTTPQEWTREVDDHLAEARRRRTAAYPEMTVESHRHHDAIARTVFTGGLARDYNDAVGWVELIWDGPGPVIKGYGFRTEQQRVQRRFLPRYVYIHKVLECWFHRGQTSEEISSEVRRELEHVTRRAQPYARRWIDLGAFDAISPHLDWPRLVGLES